MNPNKKLQEKIFIKFLNFFHEAVKTIAAKNWKKYTKHVVTNFEVTNFDNLDGMIESKSFVINLIMISMTFRN